MSLIRGIVYLLLVCCLLGGAYSFDLFPLLGQYTSALGTEHLVIGAIVFLLVLAEVLPFGRR